MRRLAFVFFMSCAAIVQAESGDKGAAKAVACAACHGAKGVSSVPIYPNLAGQKQAYLEKQLKDFRSGQRKDPIMGPQATGLSDDDIADLAAFYASLK